ncbi:hypothetical protein CesoFtcFv8_020515 [Champsocephalus esox]|uniref:Uncharacterized protein n=1 Tax=Champsocephalus esox TaxID=159716 RepID=A0AAN8GL98_9TELE|nr:hypothetical protein CesoFtcFv8_020515 [Champsocephalus esox]
MHEGLWTLTCGQVSVLCPACPQRLRSVSMGSAALMTCLRGGAPLRDHPPPCPGTRFLLFTQKDRYYQARAAFISCFIPARKEMLSLILYGNTICGSSVDQ